MLRTSRSAADGLSRSESNVTVMDHDGHGGQLPLHFKTYFQVTWSPVTAFHGSSFKFPVSE